MSDPLRRYKIHVDVYGVTLNLCVGPRESFANLINNKYDKLDQKEEPPGCDGKYFAVQHTENGTIHHYVWVEAFDWSIRQQGLLAHELLHFVLALHRHVGIPAVEDAEESLTYTFQYVMCEAWSKLRHLR